MVQAVTDTRDTAKMFRDDADILAIRPSAAPANNRRNLNSLFGLEDEGKPKSFDPNGDSDAAILLRRSGYRQTDEKTREGVYHVAEERTEAAVVARAAAAAQTAAANSLAAQARSWIRSCGDAARDIGNRISETVSDIGGYVSDKISSFGSSAADMLKSMKNGAASIGTSISNGFDTYIAKPVGAAAGWVGNKISEYTPAPLKNAAGYVADKVSGAWDWAMGNDDKPAAAQPASAPAAARAAPAAAAAQPLAGAKSNVSSGFSLSGAFDSAVDGAKDLLGWSTPAPTAAPAPRR